MKILFVNKYFYLKGGSERVFFQERDYFRSENYDVLDFSTIDQDNVESEYSRFFIRNIDFKYLNNMKDKAQNAINFIHSRSAIRQLLFLLESEKPQIAHLHNIYHQLTPAIIPILKKKGIKVLLTLHDYKLVCPKYTLMNQGKICDKCKGRFFFHALTSGCTDSFIEGLLFSAESYWHSWRRSYEMVDYFLAPSRFMADMVSSRQILQDRILLLRNGIDTKDYKPEYENDGYALYFGRLSNEKGIRTLLKAHTMLKKKIPLKIVGTGPLENELRKEFPLAEYCGYKSGEALKAIIKKASFIIVPSEWYENCSMVVLEAMALGKPVIGSRIGGIPEQIEDNVTGMLFDMGNELDLSYKIEILSSNSDLCQTMGRAARAKLEKEYSLDMHFSELSNIYSKTIQD